MSVGDEIAAQSNICGKWMPRKNTHCARGAGHSGDCRTPEFMEKLRADKRANKLPYDPVAARRWRAAHRFARYGLTREQFDQKLADQGSACAMCGESFGDGRRICVDHDHRCCPQEKKSCGKCVRGLLCVPCNITLGFIESEQRQAQARQYLSEWQNADGDASQRKTLDLSA